MRTFLLFAILLVFFSGCTQNEQQVEVKEIKPHTLAEDAAKSGIKWDEEGTAEFMKKIADHVQSSNSSDTKPVSSN